MRSSNRLMCLVVPCMIALAACGSTQPADHASLAGSSASVQTNNVKPVSQAVGTSTPVPGTGDTVTAKLSEITGGVLAREAQDSSFAESSPGYVLQALGQVKTQIDGRVRLDFPTGTLLRLGPSTLFTMQPAQQSPQGLLVRVQLTLGKLWIILRGGSLQVQTQSGVAAVQGSLMSVDYNPDNGVVKVTCLEGHCSLSDDGGTVQITTGQTALLTEPKIIPQVGTMSTQDYQDWASNNPEAGAFVPVTGGNPGPPLQPRQAGTVVTTTGGPQIIPVTGGGQNLISIGSCATAWIVTPPDPPAGVTYTASVVPEELLPKELPGKLISCAVKVVAAPTTATLGGKVEVCFPMMPDQKGFAFDWHGPWQKTDILPSNGQSCVIIPADAVNASYAGLFIPPAP